MKPGFKSPQSGNKGNMQISSFELRVEVNGKPIREYGHNCKTWIEGRPGCKFTLRFRNGSANRVLAIPSIDGISVIDGEPANRNSRGWVVDGYRSVEIKGWRTSMDESAEFVFEKKDGSYAKITTGVGGNEGVIGVKAIGEKVGRLMTPKVIEHHHHHYPEPAPKPVWPFPHNPWDPTWTLTRSIGDGFTSTAFNASDGCAGVVGEVGAKGDPGIACYSASVCNQMQSLPTPETALGTAFGTKQTDRVSEVDFERGRELATLEIYYSDETSLRTAGVLIDRVDPPVSKPLPVAFGGFCKPPGRAS